MVAIPFMLLSQKSNPDTQAEVTTKKFGLEAGLFKVGSGGTRYEDNMEVCTHPSEAPLLIPRSSGV
jgi:hypothetical protein